MKRNITLIRKIWKDLNKDKDLLRRMIDSIPRRLEAVIRKGGEQIYKSDHKITKVNI